MKTKPISNLEQEVMNLVWSRQTCSVRDIVNEINGTNSTKPVAYTTILTVVQRLHEKGLVTKKAGQKAFLYSPKVSKESYSRSMAQTFLKKFLHSFGEIGIASFAQSIDSLSKEERSHLIQLLDSYDKNK